MATKTRTQVVLMPARYRVWCDACDRHVASDLTAAEAGVAEAAHLHHGCHQLGLEV